MTPANLSLEELQKIQNNTILSDAFVTAYNVLFHTNIQVINQISITEEVVQKINHAFNQWLLFLCNTYIVNELKTKNLLPELEKVKPVTIHRSFIVKDIHNQDKITQIMRQILSGYDLADFCTIFNMSFGQWEYQRVRLTKNSYLNIRQKSARTRNTNAVFEIPKRQKETTKRAFKSIFGISVAEALASATFMLLKESLKSSKLVSKQTISSQILKIHHILVIHLKKQTAAQKSKKTPQRFE